MGKAQAAVRCGGPAAQDVMLPDRGYRLLLLQRRLEKRGLPVPGWLKMNEPMKARLGAKEAEGREVVKRASLRKISEHL